MFKHYFEGIEHVTIGPVIGLIIFFVFFLFLIYQVTIADKGFISKMGNMPLDDNTKDEQDESNTTQT